MTRRGACAACLLAVLLSAAGAARADGISGLIEEEVSKGSTDLSDAASGAQRLQTAQFTQRYRLAFDRALWPNLRFSTGGLFEQLLGSSDSLTTSSDLSSRTSNLYANLAFGSQVLSGAAGYTRREAGSGAAGNPLVAEELSASLGWRPEELPSLAFRYAHPTLHDASGRVQDTVADAATLTLAWNPRPKLSLRYTFDWSNPRDNLRLSETIAVRQTGGADYGATFAAWNTTVAASLSVATRRTLVNAAGDGATLATQQFPIQGLSAVESFPATPALVALTPNPGLLDGNLTAPASINLGVAATPPGDPNVRSVDLGLRFTDAVTPVNALYVWVDQSLVDQARGLDLAAKFTWTAWQSDDNLHWTQVPVVQPAWCRVGPDCAPVVFPALQNRFEISIQPTQAQYLKVVTRPLVAADTSDPRFANVMVTEVQALNVQAVMRSSGWQKSDTQLLTLGLRTQLLGRSDLSFDSSVQLARNGQTGGEGLGVAWIVASGLSYGRKLSPIFLLSGRVARQDADQLRGHTGAWQWGVSLGAEELPTLGHSLSYSGQASTSAAGTATSNSIAFFNHATPYRGIGLQAGISWSIANSPGGETNRSNLLTLSASLQPHPKLTLSAGYGRTGSVLTGGARPSETQVQQHLDAGLSFNPIAALYFAGGLTWTKTEVQDYTLANLQAGFSPFQGGALQLTFGFNQTLDSGGAVTRQIAPGLRWNVNRSIVLTASYSLLDSSGGAAGETHQRTLGANLRIPL